MALLVPFAASGQPEEIIVTARKLPEDISRVPMSVQALSGSFLERRNLTSLYELQLEIPGFVAANRGMFGSGLALRGVTDEGGGSLAIAPHLNGAYLGQSNLALARLFDVERVEIVKGPQGTLYGRNATGGTVNVVTRAPEKEFVAAVAGAFGSFDTARIEGHVNLPAQKLATRIAAVASAGDGFIRNSVDGRRFAEEDYAGARISLRAQPTTSLTIDVMGEHVEDDGASTELWSPRKDYLPNPSDIWLTTVTQPDPYLTTTNDFGNLNVAFDLGDLTLQSITAYARNVTRALDDCAGIPQLQGCRRSVHPLNYEQVTQELRLESPAGESLNWVAGIFYLNGDETQNFTYGVGAPAPINDLAATADDTAYAVFGDVTHALGERWSLSGGLRFSRDERRVTQVGTGTADAPAPRAAEDSWDDTSWRLGVEFSPSDTMLVYATASTGFKSGGITANVLLDGQFDGYDPEELLAYEAGVSAALPGGRSTLRASAFHYDFDDMQVLTIALFGNNQVQAVIDNAAAARIYGLDLSAATRVSDRVTLSGALVWMPKREFVEFIAASSGASLAGNTISRAPEWSVSASFAYRLPVGRLGELAAEVDYNYRTEFFFTKENNPLLSQDDFGLLNLILRLEPTTARWHASLSARNVLDTEYFNQMLIQSAPGQPASYDVGFGYRF